MRLHNKTTRHLLFLAGAVIILLVLSCFLGLTLLQEKMIKNSVHLSAQRLFESIVLTRRWNAQYGGVLVRKYEGMQSNPYLEHPDVITATGLTYTLKNPALMTREISELSEQYGHYQYHITSLKLMNPNNQPDAWERTSLQQFEKGVAETTQVARVNGEEVYRFMRPLLVEDGCMQCHGKQGYVGGEVRGGISVSLPYQQISISLVSNRMKMAVLGLSIVAILSFLFYFVIWRLIGHLFSISSELERQKGKLEKLNTVLDQKVTERTQAFQESEQRFRSTFEQAPVGICHIGLDGLVLRVNRHFCEIFALSSSALLNMRFQDISHETKRIVKGEDWNALLLGEKESFSLERRYLHGDLTEAWISLTMSLVKKDTGEPHYFICVVEDMSERRSLQQQLQQAQKMEAIGTLAGGIAHDFNNILTPILGYTEMLLEDARPGEKQFTSLQAVFHSAVRAQELIRQFLTFSRRNDAERQPLNIVIVVKEVIKLLRSFLPSSVEVAHFLTNEDCIVQVNPTQIHQIMMNLCTNAYQAMHEGSGVLTIELTVNEPGEEPALALTPGRYAVLVVRDTGCGMDRRTMERMYEPYFTTKSQSEGTGLGLAMVHGIVEDLGGAIKAESVVGKGTQFTLYLPLVDQCDSRQRILPLDEEAMVGGNESILLVDDEPAIVSMEAAMLRDLGYKVTSFHRATEALEHVRQQAETYDLVITDITMPELSGVALAREIGAIRAHLPIILCTGFSAEYRKDISRQGNIAALLTKPILKRDLARAIRNVLDGQEKQGMGENITK